MHRVQSPLLPLKEAAARAESLPEDLEVAPAAVPEERLQRI